MTDLSGSAGDAYDLPPYDPYAGWDAPAPYIKDTPVAPAAPAVPDGLAEAIAAGLLPDPSKTPAPQAYVPAAPAAVSVDPALQVHGAAQQYALQQPQTAPQAYAAPQPYVPTQPFAPAPATPLTLMPKLPEMELPALGRTYELAPSSKRTRASLIDGVILAVPTGLVLMMILPSILHGVHHDGALSQQIVGGGSSASAISAIDAPSSATSASSILGGAGTGTSSIMGDESRLKHWIFVVSLVSSLVYWTFSAAYNAFFMSQTNGQTPGRAACGIRIMRADGERITWGWAVWRSVILGQVVFGIASFFTFGLASLAQYGWSLWDHDKRALHDVIARSRVVVD